MGIKVDELPDGSIRLSFPKPVSGLTLNRANRITLARRLLEGMTTGEKIAAVFNAPTGTEELLARIMGRMGLS